MLNRVIFKSFGLLVGIAVVFLAGCESTKVDALSESDKSLIRSKVQENNFKEARTIVKTAERSPAYNEMERIVDEAEIAYNEKVIEEKVGELSTAKNFTDLREFLKNYRVQSTARVTKELETVISKKLAELNQAELEYLKQVLRETITNLVKQGKFEEAREYIWTSTNEMAPEYKAEIEKLKIDLLRKQINIAHLSHILEEMKTKINEYVVAHDFKSAYAYLDSLKPFRIYTAELSLSLANVKQALKELNTSEPETSAIFNSAMETLNSFFQDPTLISDSKIEKGFVPDASEFNKKLEEFKKTMELYGCSVNNQNALVDAIRKDAQPLIEALIIPDKTITGVPTTIGTSKLNEIVAAAKQACIEKVLIPQEIEYLKAEMLSEVEQHLKNNSFKEAREFKVLAMMSDAEAIKAEIDEYRKHLLETKITPAEIEYLKGEMLAAVERSLKLNNFKEAREVIWTFKRSDIDKINEELDNYRIQLLNYKVNTADYSFTAKNLREEIGKLVQSKDFKGARAYLDSVKPISVYTELITIALYSIRDELINGVTADRKGVEELIANAEKLLTAIFANNEEIQFEPGEFFKPDIDNYLKLVDAFKAVLAKYGCSEEQQIEVVALIKKDADKLIRALYRPGEGEVLEMPKAMGTGQYNKKIAELKRQIDRDTITPAEIAARISELRAIAVPLIEKRSFEEAREKIHTFGVVGVPSVDIPVFLVKVGLIDVLINPVYIEDILPGIKAKVEELVDKKEFDKARALVKTLKEVPCYSQTIDEALTAAAKYAVKNMSVSREEYDKYIQSLMTILKDTAGVRHSNDLGVAKDERKEKQLWDEFEALLLVLRNRMLADDFKEQDVEKWLDELKANCRQFIVDNEAKCISDSVLNAKIRGLRNELEVLVASKLAEERERQAAAKAKVEEEARKKMEEIAARIAKEAAEQVDFPARCQALRQAAVNLTDENLALVLLEAAYLLKKDEMGLKINQEDASALVVAGAYLGFDDIINYGIALGAKLDSACSKDKLARSPYLVAIQANFPGNTSSLLARANLAVTDAEGNNVIHYAIKYSNRSVFVSALTKKINANAVGSNGMTPLILAADLQAISFVKALLPYAKIDVQDAEGFTALMRAASHGCLDIVKTLIDAKAKTEIINKQGAEVLEVACDSNVVDVIAYLVKDVKLKATPRLINKVVEGGKVAVLTILVDATNVNDSHLAIAIEKLDMEMIDFITTLGVDVNSTIVKNRLLKIKEICSIHHRLLGEAKWFAQLNGLSVSTENGIQAFVKSITEKVPYEESLKSDDFQKLLKDINELKKLTTVSIEQTSEEIELMEKVYDFMIGRGTKLPPRVW